MQRTESIKQWKQKHGITVVVGIDPSLSNTGICSGHSPENKNTTMKCIGRKPKKGETFKTVAQRVVRINELIDQIKDHLTRVSPDIILIEAYAHSKNQKGKSSTIEFGGVLRCLLVEQAKQVIEVSPTTLKKFVLGKGVGNKELIIANVYKRWGVLFESSDEADAYVLYRMGLCYAGFASQRSNRNGK